MLDDSIEVPFQWAKLHINDWILGTQDFSCELEGAYCRFCLRLYQIGRPLPDDDRAMSMRMSLSLRVWKRLKTELVRLGKIIVRNGYLTNSRFEKEREERAATLRKHSQGAIEMHERRRAKAATRAASPDKFGQKSAQTSAKLDRNIDEKLNKINDDELLEQGHTRKKSQIEEKDSSLRSESAPSPSADVAPSEPELELDDPGKRVWGKCVPWLIEETGKPDRTIRPLVGRWQKTLTHHELLQAFRSAAKAKKANPDLDPVAYIAKIVSEAKAVVEARCRRENGKIVVVNGFAAEIGDLLKGRDVQRTLDRINGKIPQHVVGIDLEAKVRSLAIELVDQEEGQDRRYLKAAAERQQANGQRDRYPSVRNADESFLEKVLARELPDEMPRPVEEVH